MPSVYISRYNWVVTGFDLRAERRAARLSQQQLAQRCGISQSNISAFETGSRRPEKATIAKLQRALRPYPAEALADNAAELLALADAHGLGAVRVFGSITSGTDTWDSDIDLLVSASPGTGVFTLAAFAAAASDLLGYPVDVLPDSTPGPIADAARMQALAV